MAEGALSPQLSASPDPWRSLWLAGAGPPVPAPLAPSQLPAVLLDFQSPDNAYEPAPAAAESRTAPLQD